MILRVEFEEGGFGNPTRKEGKALEVDGESEKNEDDDDDGEDIVEIEVNTIFVLFYDIVGFCCRNNVCGTVCVCVCVDIDRKMGFFWNSLIRENRHNIYTYGYFG